MRRRIQSDSDGEEEIEEVEEVQDSDYEELDEIEEDVKSELPSRRRSTAERPRSTRSTRASSTRSARPSPAAGPSTAPTRKGKQRLTVAVEIPLMPFSTMRHYSYTPGLKPPTAETRRRLPGVHVGVKEAAIREPQTRPPTTDRTRESARSSNKRARRSTSRRAEGHGDDDGEFMADASEPSEPSEADESSDDSLLTRRIRPRVFEPRDTRAQRKKLGTPPSEQPRYTRQQAATQQAHWETQPASPPVSEYAPQSEGESEIDEVDMDELDSDSDYDNRAAYSGDEGDVDILTRHRAICERCRLGPADELLAKARKTKQRGRKRKYDIIDEPIDPEEHAESLEGWIECVRCPVSSHWKCLTPAQQRKVLAEIAARDPDEEGRRSITIDESATFTCSRCEAYPVCFVCEKKHIKRPKPDREGSTDGNGAPVKSERSSHPGAKDDPIDVEDDQEGGLIVGPPAPLLFRCDRCKQAAHYEHLRDPFPPEKKYTTSEIAAHYQKSAADGTNAWNCHSCRDWKWLVDRVIAWRPLPADAEEPPLNPGELPNYRDRLPREYLVKWKGRGFRHLNWVPHAWLLSINGAKLRNFIQKGPQLDLVTNETLAAKGDEMSAPTIRDIMDEEPQQRRPRDGDAVEEKWWGHGPPPDADAENSIPLDWSTIDRILEVHLLPPKGGGRKAKRRIEDSDDEDESPLKRLQDGIAPPTSLAVPIRDWELRAGRQLTADDIDEVAPLVTWALVKWQNLQYDEACYDTPPPKDSPLYPAYKRALERYLLGRQVRIPILSQTASKRRDEEAALKNDPPEGQPDCVKGGKLMPFQIEGLQWLIYKYFHRQSCILADDMGLGKTVQVASFLGYLHSQGLYPSLVIVPNSTITNWVREIEKWVPDVRAVPYYGEAVSRKLIATYELYHPEKHLKPDGLKAHVVLTTYESFIQNWSMFKAIPRWESVIVDEGQRMKSDSSLLFARLKQVHSVFRVLLTGTPLNNNLRELFNLLNFLDPDTFRALKELESRFENLNEGLLTELHDLISPYILRRIKRDVLKLPPKVEIIVPIAMTPVQKQVTREILHSNVDTIEQIVKKRKNKAKAKAKAAEVVDITDEAAPPNAAEGERTADAGPSGSAGGTSAEGPRPSESATKSAAEAKEAVETEDVIMDGVDDDVVLVDNSQPASQPQSNGSAKNKSECDQRRKLQGGFSVKGAAAAAARIRWDRHRRELGARDAAISLAEWISDPQTPATETSESECTSVSDSEVFKDPQTAKQPPQRPQRRGGGGFSVPGAAAAAANLRWAKVREERAGPAVRPRSTGGRRRNSVLSSDNSSEPERTTPPPRPQRRRRPPVEIYVPAAKPSGPSRHGGFNVEGAAAKASKARWAKFRRERALRDVGDAAASDDSSESQQRTFPPARRRSRPIVAAVVAADSTSSPPRRGGFSVEGAAARAANARWAKVRRERAMRAEETSSWQHPPIRGADATDANASQDAPAEPTSTRANGGTHSPDSGGSAVNRARTNGSVASGPGPHRQSGSGTPSVEQNGSAAPGSSGIRA